MCDSVFAVEEKESIMTAATYIGAPRDQKTHSAPVAPEGKPMGWTAQIGDTGALPVKRSVTAWQPCKQDATKAVHASLQPGEVIKSIDEAQATGAPSINHVS